MFNIKKITIKINNFKNVNGQIQQSRKVLTRHLQMHLKLCLVHLEKNY